MNRIYIICIYIIYIYIYIYIIDESWEGQNTYMWIYYIERERREKRIIKSNPKNQTLSKMDCKICQNKTPIRLED